MIVDCHAHLAPTSMFERANQELPGVTPRLLMTNGGPVIEFGHGRQGPLPLQTIDVGLSMASLSRMGVDTAVFSLPPFLFLYELASDAGRTWAQIANEALADSVDENQGTYGLATVPLQDAREAALELERAVTKLGLRGVEIASNIAGVELDDPALTVFFEAAQDLDVPILIHPHYVAGLTRMRDYFLRNLIGNPVDTTLAAARLILGGVFERFPRLKVCLSHAGGYLLAGLGRLDHGYKVRTDVGLKLSRPPSAFLKNLYFDTIGHSTPWLRFVIQNAGADHVLLGTDQPFDMGESNPVGNVRSASPAQPDLDKISCQNAVRLLRLSGYEGLETRQ